MSQERSDHEVDAAVVRAIIEGTMPGLTVDADGITCTDCGSPSVERRSFPSTGARWDAFVCTSGCGLLDSSGYEP